MARTITLTDARINSLAVYYGGDGLPIELVAEYVLLAADGTPFGNGKSITIPLSAGQRNTLKNFAVTQLMAVIRQAEAMD